MHGGRKLLKSDAPSGRVQEKADTEKAENEYYASRHRNAVDAINARHSTKRNRSPVRDEYDARQHSDSSNSNSNSNSNRTPANQPSLKRTYATYGAAKSTGRTRRSRYDDNSLDKEYLRALGEMSESDSDGCKSTESYEGENDEEDCEYEGDESMLELFPDDESEAHLAFLREQAKSVSVIPQDILSDVSKMLFNKIGSQTPANESSGNSNHRLDDDSRRNSQGWDTASPCHSEVPNGEEHKKSTILRFEESGSGSRNSNLSSEHPGGEEPTGLNLILKKDGSGSLNTRKPERPSARGLFEFGFKKDKEAPSRKGN